MQPKPHLILRILSGISAVAFVAFGLFLSALGVTSADTYFRLYLPNKNWVDKCSGSCSIDGFSNLDVSGAMAIMLIVFAIACFVPGFFFFRFAGQNSVRA